MGIIQLKPFPSSVIEQFDINWKTIASHCEIEMTFEMKGEALSSTLSLVFLARFYTI